MRHVPSRAWLAAAVVVALAAGCRHTDAPADGMPGQTPASFLVREAPDARNLVIHPAPRVVTPIRYAPAPAPQADNPIHAQSTIYWHAKPEPDAPVKIDAPRPLIPRRIAASDHVVYAHAPDHRWLLGSLVCESAPKRWSLRYATQGEPDPYGGVLELLDLGPMGGFVAGQIVRVEGELVDPQPYQIKPAFRVRSIQTQLR